MCLVYLWLSGRLRIPTRFWPSEYFPWQQRIAVEWGSRCHVLRKCLDLYPTRETFEPWMRLRSRLRCRRGSRQMHRLTVSWLQGLSGKIFDCFLFGTTSKIHPQWSWRLIGSVGNAYYLSATICWRLSIRQALGTPMSTAGWGLQKQALEDGRSLHHGPRGGLYWDILQFVW